MACEQYLSSKIITVILDDVRRMGSSGLADKNYFSATVPIKNRLLDPSSLTASVVTCRCACSNLPHRSLLPPPPPFRCLILLFVSLCPLDDRGFLKIEANHPDYSVLITELEIRRGCGGLIRWQAGRVEGVGRQSGTVSVNCVLISVVCHSEALRLQPSIIQPLLAAAPSVHTCGHVSF